MDTKNLYLPQAFHFSPRPELFETECVAEVESRLQGLDKLGLTSKTDRRFLNGLIRHIRPQKVLELGVFAGYSSATILNAIKDIPNSLCYSVDLMGKFPLSHLESRRLPNPTPEYVSFEESAAKSSLLPGFLVEKRVPDLASHWKLMVGVDISQVIETIGDNIDFVFIDTAHYHPCETLNFICILPFLKPETWVVLHDVSIFTRKDWFNQLLATKYLFDAVSAYKLVPDEFIGLRDNGWGRNIAAFQVNAMTCKQIYGVFDILTLPWAMDFQPQVLESMIKIVEKYYQPELIELFHEAIEIQKSYKTYQSK